MASKVILFLKETGAPHFLRPVSVVHHPDFPSPRYEVLFRLVGRGRKYQVRTEWFSRKRDALAFVKELRQKSE